MVKFAARCCIGLAATLAALGSPTARAAVVSNNAAAFNIDFPVDTGSIELIGPRSIVQFDLAAGLNAAGVITSGAGLTAALIGLDANGNSISGAIADVSAGLTVNNYNNSSGNANIVLDLSGTTTASVFSSPGVAFVALRISTGNNNLNTDGVQTLFSSGSETNDDCFLADAIRPVLNDVLISEDGSQVTLVFSEPLNTGFAANDVNHTVLANFTAADLQVSSSSSFIGSSGGGGSPSPSNLLGTPTFVAGSGNTQVRFTRSVAVPGVSPLNAGMFLRLKAFDDAGVTTNHDLLDRVGNRGVCVPVQARAAVVDLRLAGTDSVLAGNAANAFARTAITLHNESPIAANAVTVSSTLPSGVTFVNASVSAGSSQFSGGVFLWTVGTMAPNSSATLTLDLDRPLGSFTGSASVLLQATASNNSSDPTPSNNLLSQFLPWFSGDCNGNGSDDWADIFGGTAADSDGNFIPDSCLPPGPRLRITGADGRVLSNCFDADFRTYQGIPVERTYMLSNVGAATLTFSIPFTLPPGLIYSVPPPSTVMSGGSASFTIRYSASTALPDQPYGCLYLFGTNDGEFSIVSADVNYGAIATSSEVDLGVFASSLTLGAVTGNVFASGTYSVVNGSLTAATQTTVTFQVPSALQTPGFVASQGTVQRVGDVVTWNVGTLAPLATKTLQIGYDTTTTGVYPIMATATASNASNDATPQNNSLSQTLRYSGDCNGNGLEDWRDIYDGLVPDSNGSLAPDTCDPRIRVFWSLGDYPAFPADEYLSYADFVSEYGSTRSSASRDGRGVNFFLIDMNARAVQETLDLSTQTLDGVGQFLRIYAVAGEAFAQPVGAIWHLIDTTRLIHPDPLRGLAFGGRVNIPVNAVVGFEASTIEFQPTAELSLSPLCVAEFVSPAPALINGRATILGGVISAQNGVNVGAPGLLEGWGILPRAVSVAGNAVFFADTQAIENYTNSGTTTIQNGTLTVVGTLTNTGTIIGDFAARPGRGAEGPRAAGDGLFSRGAFESGVSSTLMLEQAGSKFGFGSDFRCAINNPAGFDLSVAEVRAAGTGNLQRFEAMSLDRGVSSAGFLRSSAASFPIGTLRVVSRASLQLEDQSDNAVNGQAVSEAVYVNALVIENGATLNTNGIKVYCRSITNTGTIIGAANVRVVPPACLADFNADGIVSTPDLVFFLGRFGEAATPGSQAERADFNGDGIVGTADLAFFLGRFSQACN